MPKQRFFPVKAILLMLLGMLGGHTHSSADPTGEEIVKTAILYNFFKFIEWPDGVAKENYRLCTSRNDHLGESLLMLENKVIVGKPLVIQREVSGDTLKYCQMLYISVAGQAESLLSSLQGLPVVTVSDQAHFIQNGGMIGLVQDGNRLNFEINLDIANASGVHISAKLLKLAKRVIISK